MDLTKEEMATVRRFGLDRPDRRTKRRFAHELYPHPEEAESRPLAVDVPYVIAQAIGFGIGREWHDLVDEGGNSSRAATDRTLLYLALSEVAFLAVALHEGRSGQEAWDRARQIEGDSIDEWLWEVAERYGVDWDAIKPYSIRSESTTHEHWSERDERGNRMLIEYRVPGKESECEECTEEVPSDD